MKPKILIVMGSDSDLAVMKPAAETLESLDIPCEITVSSAHRSPDRTVKLIKKAERDGIEIIIAGAGAAAHLAGVIASHTVLPVIGVPIDSSPLKGIDALFSTVQMPPGIPVATMSVGSAGAKNAAIFAAQILSLRNPALRRRLRMQRKKLADDVAAKARKLQKTPREK